MVLSRTRGRWVCWQMEPTAYEACIPAHEVLAQMARQYPGLMLAVAAPHQAFGGEFLAPAETQLSLPAFAA